MLIVLFLLDDYLDPSLASARFANLQLACLCAQLAFAPLVLGPMIFGKAGVVSPAWAIAVLAEALPRGRARHRQPSGRIQNVAVGRDFGVSGVGLSVYAVALLRTKPMSPAA